MKRREFLQYARAATAFAFLPAFTRDAFAAAATLDDLLISEVEILKLSGTHELVKGLNRQYQVNPLHLYEERRPKPFVDPANGKAERLPLTHYYVRIRTKGGVEGLYGAVDPEALPVLLGVLRPQIYRFKLGRFEVTQILDGFRVGPGPHPTFGQDQSAGNVHSLLQANGLPTAS